MKQYLVDAFTGTPFSGNPAAVCVLPAWPEVGWMQNMAAENNLSETAFLVRNGSQWQLRWFTPTTEVGLCGHATLASAFVLMNCLEEKMDEVQSITKEGILSVRRAGGFYALDFPRIAQQEIPVTQTMEAAFGIRPLKALLGTDLVCVFENEEQVRALIPDQTLLAELGGRGQSATAPGSQTDCVSRSFFPKLGITEDPVCGSAHCQIAPYWAGVLAKDKLSTYQASKRGGLLNCKLLGNDRIEISGNACLVAISEIQPAAMPFE